MESKEKYIIESNEPLMQLIDGFAKNTSDLARRCINEIKKIEGDISISARELQLLVWPFKRPDGFQFEANETDVLDFVQKKVHERLPDHLPFGGVRVSRSVIDRSKIQVTGVDEFLSAVQEFRDYMVMQYNAYRQDYQNPMSMVIESVLFNDQGALVSDQVEKMKRTHCLKVTESRAQAEAYQVAKQAADSLNKIMKIHSEMNRELREWPNHVGNFIQKNEVVRWNYEKQCFEPGARFIYRF